MKKGFSGYFIVNFMVLFGLMALACAASFIEAEALRYGLIILVFAAGVVYLLCITMPKSKWMVKSSKILEEYAELISKYMHPDRIPTAITEVSGKIRWVNSPFVVLANSTCEGKNIYRMYPDLNRADKNKQIEIDGKKYKKEITPVASDGKEYLMIRLIQTETMEKSVNAHKALLSVVCYIEVDNYDELVSGITQVERSQIDAQVDKLVSDWAAKSRAMLLKYKKDKYVVCFERKYLNAIQNTKFDILDEVRMISTSIGQSPTFSIAVGAGDTPAVSNSFALKAMELAHGRGGDQAAIKDNRGYVFYGGIQKAVEVKTRVRSRTASRALRNLMEQCDGIFLMGHEVPDLDCIGSALGLLACARHLGKPAHIILERTNAAISALIKEMENREEYRDVIIAPGEAHLRMTKKSMLIIVDTQIGGMTIAPGLIHRAGTLVVIDHHLRGTRSIEGATLFYHEPYASSAAEMVAEIVQYFSDRLVLKPLEAEALLAGITVDTKGFSYKTGVRTFEAASYLRRMGANTTSIQQLFQDDFETFSNRAEVVREAKVLDGGIAVSICKPDMKATRLVVAQAADSLISIRGIEASFVLAKIDGMIIISGRSAGRINVQLILESLGGGGHATIAGAQLKDHTMEEAYQELVERIQKYIKETKV